MNSQTKSGLINFPLLLSFLLIFNSCNPFSLEESYKVPVEQLKMECMDIVSRGGELEVVINSQEEYDELIYQRFQKPLDDYWNQYYDDVLQDVMQRYPGLSEDAYEDSVRKIFYSTLPFKGTDNCSQPEIDFSKHTLLGQDANAGGCETPDYNIKVIKTEENKEYLFKITIKEKGACDMAILKNIWILIPKIPDDYTVKFEKEKIN